MTTEHHPVRTTDYHTVGEPFRIVDVDVDVDAAVHRDGGRTAGVTFRNVPVVTSLGLAEADIPHAGACYAVFAGVQIDRSPRGSGTSARLALLAWDGRLGAGKDLLHESVIGTVFTGRVLPGGTDGVVTEVTGTAYRTGEHVFEADRRDALGAGFSL